MLFFLKRLYTFGVMTGHFIQPGQNAPLFLFPSPQLVLLPTFSVFFYLLLMKLLAPSLGLFLFIFLFFKKSLSRNLLFLHHHFVASYSSSSLFSRPFSASYVRIVLVCTSVTLLLKKILRLLPQLCQSF